MKIDALALGRFLTASKLWDTPLREFQAKDFRRFCEAVAEAIIEDDEPGARGGWAPPRIVGSTLVIPFNAPARYRWWQDGQSVLATLEELGADEDVIRQYISPAAFAARTQERKAENDGS